ncbi:hypothetical protein DYB36_013747 [Aphanomyces astaci]|uniref:DDE-1 domain-containing protein n=1 Tax=Aphanomyces astaci TaxID=112090 RepID=A0A397B808_APHAT|nr:hypothetical protein DYB36_013747 [Aphanomyces astaci]
MAEHNLTLDRMFNMDETAFETRRKSKKVVALKGSPNVWAKTVATNFHLSVWIGHQATIRSELLLLPSKGRRRTGQKKIDVGGCVLTFSVLADVETTKEVQIAAVKQKKLLQAKRAKKKAKRGHSAGIDGAADGHDGVAALGLIASAPIGAEVSGDVGQTVFVN